MTMSRWVTFYMDLIQNRIIDYQEHADKATAERYFRMHYRKYFPIAPKVAVRLPMSYGFPFRKFYGVSIWSFHKYFGRRADDAKEANSGNRPH